MRHNKIRDELLYISRRAFTLAYLHSQPLCDNCIVVTSADGYAKFIVPAIMKIIIPYLIHVPILTVIKSQYLYRFATITIFSSGKQCPGVGYNYHTPSWHCGVQIIGKNPVYMVFPNPS